MVTVRRDHTGEFVAVPLALAVDEELSWRARGLATWLCTKPSDWHCDLRALSRFTQEGKAAIDTALTELEHRGWLRIDDEGDYVLVTRRLTAEAESPERRPTRPKRDLTAATEIVTSWWEHHKTETGHPPAARFPACVAVVDRLLVCGWTPNQIKHALVESPVVTINALTLARSQREKRQGVVQANRTAEVDRQLEEQAHLPLVDRQDASHYIETTAQEG